MCSRKVVQYLFLKLHLLELSLGCYTKKATEEKILILSQWFFFHTNNSDLQSSHIESTRSQKLSNNRPVQYLDERPLSTSRYYKQPEAYVPD